MQILLSISKVLLAHSYSQSRREGLRLLSTTQQQRWKGASEMVRPTKPKYFLSGFAERVCGVPVSLPPTPLASGCALQSFPRIRRKSKWFSKFLGPSEHQAVERVAFSFFPSILQYLSKHCHLFSWVMTTCFTFILLLIYKDRGSMAQSQSQSKHMSVEAALSVTVCKTGSSWRRISHGPAPSRLWLSHDVNIHTSKTENSVHHRDVLSVWCQKSRYLETSG